MYKTDRTLSLILIAITLFLGIIALHVYFRPEMRVSADSGHFDYITIVSPMFIYKGGQGVLLLDKRNGNVWFIPKGNDMDISYRDPVFVVRIPLEKLDQAPR